MNIDDLIEYYTQEAIKEVGYMKYYYNGKRDV